MWYLLHFRNNNGYTKAPQCYVYTCSTCYLELYPCDESMTSLHFKQSLFILCKGNVLRNKVVMTLFRHFPFVSDTVWSVCIMSLFGLPVPLFAKYCHGFRNWMNRLYCALSDNHISVTSSIIVELGDIPSFYVNAQSENSNYYH